MSLFRKEKDLILRIVNGILLVALLIAIYFTFSNLVDILLGEDPNNGYCATKACDVAEEKCIATTCEQSDYEIRLENYNENKSIILSILSVLTFASAIFVINRKE